MDTNDLIKNVIQENVVETKKLAHELLMQKLSERLQQKFDEYAPNTFLDEESEEETEELDENLYRNELNSLLENKHKEEIETALEQYDMWMGKIRTQNAIEVRESACQGRGMEG